MMKGDLVWVRWSGEQRRGIVVDVRRDVCGGSSMSTWRDPCGPWISEVVVVPKRSELLVMMLDIDGVSWFDESAIRLGT
jgi:hypothetical protein